MHTVHHVRRRSQFPDTIDQSLHANLISRRGVTVIYSEDHLVSLGGNTLLNLFSRMEITTEVALQFSASPLRPRDASLLKAIT